ncbi:MAG: histidine kinase [Chitinophagaceae bacterium]|nr:histidine kinase [Chitinophagaceae bacterium]
MKTAAEQGLIKYYLLHLLMQLLLPVFLVQYTASGSNDTVAAPRMILRSALVNTVEKRYDTVLCFLSGENNFEFIFEAVDLSFSGPLLFRYRLNQTEAWKTTGEKKLLFPALSAGQYRFEVAAKNDKSDWSEPVIFPFTIVPPFYQRWWFVLSAFVAVVVITAFIVNRRNRQLLKVQQQQFVAQQRMNEMENQAKQAMMNPHFVFNALNSIQQYINDNDRISANKYLTKFSRLIRLNLDLVNKRLITLEEEFEKLKLYLEIEQLRFGEKLKYEFIIDRQLETDVIFIPSMIVQPFVENAIWHGLMASSKGGTITVHATSFDKEKMLRIEISDDGIGINQSKKLNQQKSRKSFGIELTIDRLKLFGKKYGKEAMVTFTDLSEESSTKHGTLVVIAMPLIFDKNVAG